MSWTRDLLALFGLDGKSTFERWKTRALAAVERAAESFEDVAERATEAAGSARRRTGARLQATGKRAAKRARASRDQVSERVEAIARRAAEIREERRRRRGERSAARRAARRRRRAAPMRLDVRRDDRVVLRARAPVDLRLPDGGVIRYRYYERPGRALRLYLHLTGRQLWPPR